MKFLYLLTFHQFHSPNRQAEHNSPGSNMLLREKRKCSPSVSRASQGRASQHNLWSKGVRGGYLLEKFSLKWQMLHPNVHEATKKAAACEIGGCIFNHISISFMAYIVMQACFKSLLINCSDQRRTVPSTHIVLSRLWCRISLPLTVVTCRVE